MNLIELTLKAPLFTDWTEQLVYLRLPGALPGTPLALLLDERPAEFQYTGNTNTAGAEVAILLAFAKGLWKPLP